MAFFDVMNQMSELSLTENVRQHLQLLLNTRQGSLPHMPDYGLPDISEIYAELPHSIDDFARSIEKCVYKYEPRLKQIRVRKSQEEKQGILIHLLIEGLLLDKKPGLFKTAFTTKGVAHVMGHYHDTY